jgi:quercetin dioxygenase-like cupin family protein
MLPDGVFQFDTQKKSYDMGGTVANVMRIPKGCSIGKHKHPYAHMSVLVSGEAVVVIGGTEEKHMAGLSFIEIEENTSHVIHAIEDSIWMCIHSKQDINDLDQLKLVVGG